MDRIRHLAQPMQRAARALRWSVGLLALILVFAACAIGGTTGPAGPTATPTPPPCNTHATATAIVWSEGQQIHGGINGAGPAQLSNFSYPLGLPDEGFEGNQTIPGLMTVSPDGHHIPIVAEVFVPF